MTSSKVQSEVKGVSPTQKAIPVGVSARHLHVTKEHLEILFGEGATLHPKKELMGGQYAANECVTIVGINLRVIENVRILGPVRKETQVELAKTDAIRLGINPPIRESGQIKGSSPITIVGPKGALYLEEGCIVAKRHIHMNEKDAALLGVEDNEIVSVEMGGERKGRFDNVQIRVHPSFTLEMHIDTDEANALGASCKQHAIIMK
ncbi:phosphate propanoyltransferase [Sporanaerobium hydrogeniformans]|uniref:Phosphate propanoyltransferase n=1 Tax=Sporanaerobium hydrogeniformans TaxID=3072179 RepID=A0AC61DIE5_9FIRM|nr:phosphate propanoyltransferase [Sporanaerobium hydrogeniformans]